MREGTYPKLSAASLPSAADATGSDQVASGGLEAAIKGQPAPRLRAGAARWSRTRVD
jgi:hypothetical protein